MTKHFDLASIIVIVVTFVLFAIALFVKGFAKDLLLEAGVLLVSIKLIMMAHKNNVANQKVLQKVQDVITILEKPNH